MSQEIQGPWINKSNGLIYGMSEIKIHALYVDAGEKIFECPRTGKVFGADEIIKGNSDENKTLFDTVREG
jgi:hypothetical protein